MKKYRLNSEAKEDLRRIYHWGYKKYGEAQADAYYNAFFDRFEAIAENPLLYQSVDEVRKGYRRSICGSDCIYYRIEGQFIEIMTILRFQDIDLWLR